jgi:3-isopropylmalate/(R)-2-methylmalate dehydratase large subunit
MSRNTLYDKIWSAHAVKILETGETQLAVDLHKMHEVTSPQAFEELAELGLPVAHPERTFATLDHVIPTDCVTRPFKDNMAEQMASALEENCRKHGITYFGPGSGRQGVVHAAMEEIGLIEPGMTVVCGDSHTCTDGAFGALSFGIGTTAVRDVLATQSIATKPVKVRRVNFEALPEKGVTAKDLALFMISTLGVKGGLGFAYEYTGEAVRAMSMEERMTLCNMSVEGGARLGYVNPDEKTFMYLATRLAPKGETLGSFKQRKTESWKRFVSDRNAVYDDETNFCAPLIAPMVSWGTTPAQSTAIVGGTTPYFSTLEGEEQKLTRRAFEYMGLEEGQPIEGLPVDEVFIGSCTNGRLDDLIGAAYVLRGRKVKVPTLIVPATEHVAYQAAQLGLDKVFKDAGADYRKFPGCSKCLAMNPDRVPNYKRCASTSNRNFEGRQGSPFARTHLVSPLTAAATAIEGAIADPRKYL